MDNFRKQDDTGLDTNVLNTVTTAIDLNGAGSVQLYISAATGTHVLHGLTLQAQIGGRDWLDIGGECVGCRASSVISVIADKVRAKVTTVEGGVSTVNISLVAV